MYAAATQPLQYDACLECGCALVGDEKRFCDECYQEMLHVEDGLDAPDLDDAVAQCVQAFIADTNADMNLLVDTMRNMRIRTRDFAQRYNLDYTAYKQDLRFKQDSDPSKVDKKEDTK